MKLVLLLTGLAVLCSAAHAALIANPILDSALVQLRAGAKKGSKINGKERITPTNARSGKKGSKKTASKYGSSRKNSVLTQYGRGKAKKGPGLRDKLEKIAKQGQSIYKDVYRRAKVLQSSAFEAMLLKATWPSNDPVQPEILGEIVKYSIPAFKFASTESEDDPYYMTLHKLWTKMSEKDWRTVAKSLYILHTIERDCQMSDCQKFGAAIKDMAKTRNLKNPEHRYFEIGKIADLEEAGAEFEPFVRAYASYVVARAKSSSARFEELKSLGEKSSEKQVLGALKKAQQLISLGLQTEVQDKKHVHAITGHAIKQVALDLRDLQAQIGEKVAMFVAGGKFSGNSTNPAPIAEALKAYVDSREKVKGFLSRSAKLFVRLRIKIPTDFDTSVPAPKADVVSARIKELSSLFGGSTSTSTTSSTTTGVSYKRVLQRADRPLTPQEVQWSVELRTLQLQGQLSRSDRSSISAASISSGLQECMHSYGGSSRDTDDDVEQDEGDDDEEEGLENDEGEVEDKCTKDCSDSHGECDDDQCDDAACGMGEQDDVGNAADEPDETAGDVAEDDEDEVDEDGTNEVDVDGADQDIEGDDEQGDAGDDDDENGDGDDGAQDDGSADEDGIEGELEESVEDDVESEEQERDERKADDAAEEEQEEEDDE